MAKITIVSQENFQTEVLNYQGVVVVDFFAEWCGPCRILGPVLDNLSQEIKEIKFVKVNVDKNPELVSQYSIFSIPTVMIIKDGQIISQLVGAQSKETLVKEINKVLIK